MQTHSNTAQGQGTALPVLIPASARCIGRSYGLLRVISVAGFKSKRIYFNCLCACGRARVTSANKLEDGIVRACRECARASAYEKARAMQQVTPAQIVADWKHYLLHFNHKQRAAYYGTLARKREFEEITDEVRVATVAEILIEWRERVIAYMEGRVAA